MSRWDDAMRVALDEARRAITHDDVPVGAVVLDPDGQIIGIGRNQRELLADPTLHAEVVAIRDACAARGSWRLDGCTLVVTLEPCVMCAGAIVASRIERLVMGAFDEKAGAVSSVWDLVRDSRLLHRVDVVTEIGADESSELLRGFFEAKRFANPQ